MRAILSIARKRPEVFYEMGLIPTWSLLLFILNLSLVSTAPKCSSKLVPVRNAYGFGMEDESYIEFSVMKGKLNSK